MSFVDVILRNLLENPDRSLLREMHGAREVPIQNAALLHKVQSIRAQLRKRGVNRGDRVGLVAKNSIDWVATDLALLTEGAVSVPLYARQGAPELAELIEQADPVLVVAAESLRGSLSDALPPSLSSKVCSLEELTKDLQVPVEGEVPTHADDVVTIIFTSGTSGTAKGAVLNRGNCDFMLGVTRDGLERLFRKAQRLPQDDRVFHYLPFCFAGSRILLWTCLARGTPICISTDLDQLKDELKGAAPNLMLNVPFLLERIRTGVETKLQEKSRVLHQLFVQCFQAFQRISASQGRKRDHILLRFSKPILLAPIRKQIGAQLDALLCGSAPLQEDTQRWFQMVGIPVVQIYGLTETTAIVTMDEPEEVRPGFVGLPVTGVEVRVHESGELWTRGPHVFPGYFRNEDATAAVMADGWFKSGDLVETDERGRIRIIGRAKNVLVLAAGHNVAPEPLEAQLQSLMPRAEHVVLVGHGKPFLVAVVTGSCGQGDVDRAIEETNRSLPHYKRIRANHLSQEPLTPENGLLTANQKLKRQAIDAHFRDVLDGIYATSSQGGNKGKRATRPAARAR